MLGKDDYMIIAAGILGFLFLIIALVFCGTTITKPVYPMFNMRCLIVADSITTIEQTCTVLGEIK